MIDLDPDVVEILRLTNCSHDGACKCRLCQIVALVEKVVKERHIIAGQWEHAVKACDLLKEERDAALSASNALAKQANEMEERAERNAALHAEVMRERDALLKPHNSDGTITCPECGKSMGGDGLVEALRGAIEERDQLYAANDETNVTVMRMQADLDAALAAQKDLQQALDHLTEDRDAAVKDMLATEAAQKDADRERGLLRDKWNQMEAYGFDSPSKVFARLELVEKAQKEAEERLKWHHDPETRAAGYCEACANAINNSDYLRTRTETKA